MNHRITFFVILAFACLCDARPARFWTYRELAAEADLIVIAMPMENTDLKEPTVFPNMQRTDDKGKTSPVAAVGVETKFEVQAVLKGEKDLKTLVFHHLRHPTPENIPNGPMLVAFEPKEQKRYLLFLKQEKDDRYVPITGQLDSAVAVKELGTYP